VFYVSIDLYHGGYPDNMCRSTSYTIVQLYPSASDGPMSDVSTVTMQFKSS